MSVAVESPQGRMSQRADGDHIHPCLRDGTDVVEGDIAGGFNLNPVMNHGDSLSHLIDGKIIQHNSVDALMIQRFTDFIEVFCFNFHTEVVVMCREVREAFPDGGIDASGRCDVVILDEDHVIESKAVIHAAADPNGEFIEDAEARGCFSRIGDLRLCAFDRVDKSPGEGSDAAHPLEYIQGDTFALEDGGKGSLGGGNEGSR